MYLLDQLWSLASSSPADWAAQVFATTDLGDVRRTRRLQTVMTAWATRPAGSLPVQAAAPAALKATYRLLHEDDLTPDALLAPHQTMTRTLAQQEPVMLLAQDTTTLDFTSHRAIEGLSPIGDGRGRGFHLQTVLAIEPTRRLPVGVLTAKLWGRVPAPKRNEGSAERARRPRESDIWGQLVRQVGPPPANVRWVHVADRGADCFSFLDAVRATGSDVVVRLVQNRCITDPSGGHLLDTLRAQPVGATRSLSIPKRPGIPGRTAQVAVSWVHTRVLPPTTRDRTHPTPAPIPLWAVRVWEPDPAGDGPPVEWLLATTVPVESADDAWERVDWYRARWVIEEFHHCLKTGCGVERTQLRDRAALERRVALLLPLAVRLLLLRSLSRVDPAAPVGQIADELMVRLTAAHTGLPTAQTVEQFVRQVARLGGHQGRTGDGPPGWRTLWNGWLRVQDLVTGAQLGMQLQTGKRCG